MGVVIGMSETFTVAVEEGVRTVIWMRSGNSEIASLSFEGYWEPDGFVGGSLEFTGGQIFRITTVKSNVLKCTELISV